ncbi:Centromere/kinetochore protein zw10 [Gryganskiella cystojenkinii]|nr:Centromere/kinetochore protein zw10 [Gryganskiella cystojenkinii]
MATTTTAAPASALSSHNFARILIGQLDDYTQQSLLLPDPIIPPSEPATLDELTQTVAVLDTEIQNAKAQVYKRLLANYGSFSEFFEHSLELKEKIDSLLVQADDLSSQTVDPETGLRQTIMASLVNHHEVSYKVQENNAILQGLQHFSTVEDILSQYESCMDAGKILQAGHCIQQAAKMLSQPPNAGSSASCLTKVLSDQCSRMTEAIDQMLDELVASAIHIISNQGGATNFRLDLSYNVKVPYVALPGSSKGTAPAVIRWHELVRALTLLDLARDKLRPLQKALVQHLLQPLIQHHEDAVLEIVRSSNDYATSTGSFISLRIKSGEATVDLFSNLKQAFQFIHQDIFLNQYSSPEFNSENYSSDTDILTHFVGRNIAKETCGLISKYYLSTTVPTDATGLKNFGDIAAKVANFEDDLISMGFLTEADRDLREFVEHIDIHYTDRKRDSLLKLGRAIIMSEEFKEVPVKDLDMHDDLEKQGGGWGRIRDPDTNLKDSCISTKAKQLIDIVLETLREAELQGESASPRLYQATRSLIDLYRALMPVHHARTLTLVPALGILFYNDCMFMARELEKIPERLEDGIPGMDEVQYDDVIPALKTLANKWLDIQVQKQREELMQSLDEAGGFQDSAVDTKFSTYERSMKQVVLVFKHLGKAWKTTLAPMTFYRVLGQLLDDVVKRVIVEIEELGDISEKESHKLALLCGQLFECEDQFDSAGPLIEETNGDSFNDEDPIHHFVKSWEKFQLMTDILELSFAEIMTRFRAGQLYMFDENELSNLICALFADTPLRQHNLEEISHGHPVPLHRS